MSIDISPSELLAKAKAALVQVQAEKFAAKKIREIENLKKKEELKAQKAREKIKVKRPEQNGVEQPTPGTQCAKVWDLANSMSTELQAPVTINLLLAVAGEYGLRPNTVRTQFAMWRKYNGLTSSRKKNHVLEPA